MSWEGGLFQRESEKRSITEKDWNGMRGDKDSPKSFEEEEEEDLKLSSSDEEDTNMVGPFWESPTNRKQK